MSGKYVKRKGNKRKSKVLLIAAIVFTAVLLALVAVLFFNPSEEELTPETVVTSPATQETVPTETEGMRISLGYGLEIVDIDSYTGAYVEDGTNEIVSAILMLKVTNSGDDAVEYARIKMDIQGELAEFTLTTLKPGETVVLLEKNRMHYDKSLDYAEMEVVSENVALYQYPLSCHEDKLSIQILDGAINVKNISGDDITGRIAIYYKNKNADLYYGGITYRIILEDGLKRDEIRQMMADHFSDTGSEIVFITIAG